jgi:hypothetical protein
MKSNDVGLTIGIIFGICIILDFLLTGWYGLLTLIIQFVITAIVFMCFFFIIHNVIRYFKK